MEHQILGQTFFLCPEKAIFWKEKRILIISDIHLGKAGHFRKSGIPVSDLIHSKDIYMIEKLIGTFQPEEVFFLGDLFHSDHNQGWEIFRRWIESKAPLKFRLILGNHDIMHPIHYRLKNLDVTEQVDLSPFSFTHEPTEDTEYYNIAGHIHPAIRLNGRGRQSLRVPCYYFNQKQAILPAFGNFTGTARISVSKNDNLFAVTGTEVIKLN